MNALWEILQGRLVRRGVPTKNLTPGEIERAANDTVRRVVTLQQGIPTEAAKEIVKFLKDHKLKKVQAAIQADQVRSRRLEGRPAGSHPRAARARFRRRAPVRQLPRLMTRPQPPHRASSLAQPGAPRRWRLRRRVLDGRPAQATSRASTPTRRSAPSFIKRVQQYVDLHQKLEATLPPLPSRPPRKQIDEHQRALGQLISERGRARSRATSSAEGPRLPAPADLAAFCGARTARGDRPSIMDENPGKVQLQVNGRYPDELPLTTMPPQVLGACRSCPEHLEYRFVGDRLILLDVHAHIIVDYMTTRCRSRRPSALMLHPATASRTLCSSSALVGAGVSRRRAPRGLAGTRRPQAPQPPRRPTAAHAAEQRRLAEVRGARRLRHRQARAVRARRADGESARARSRSSW